MTNKTTQKGGKKRQTGKDIKNKTQRYDIFLFFENKTRNTEET